MQNTQLNMLSTDVKMYISKEAFAEENRFSLKYSANEL